MKKRILAVVAAAVLALGCFSTASAVSYKSAATNGNAAEKKAAQLMAKGVFSTQGVKIDNYMGSNDDFAITNFYTLVPAKLAYIDEDGQRQEVTYEDDADMYSALANQWVFERLCHLCAQYPKDKVIRVFNLVADDADKDDPVEVTIADLDIKATKTYALRHMSLGTGEWDSTSATVTSAKAGLVKAKVTKASPYALVETKGAGTTADTAATSKTAAATGKTAAKTGEV